MLIGLPASLLLGQDATAVPITSGLTIHVVQRNETLFRIATQYNTTVDALTTINGITNPGNIQVGERLLVPSGTAAVPTTQTHTIQPGETLASVALVYQVTVAELQTWNNIVNPNQVYPGQVIEIKSGSSSATPVPMPTALTSSATPVAVVSPTLHTVVVGETLFRIALQYNVNLADIASANGITDATRIFVGQKLIIPNGGVPELLALELPAPITALNVAPLMFVEGETGSIVITTSEAATITGTFLDAELRVVADAEKTSHSILIGVPIYTEAGIYPVALQVVSNGTKIDYTFNMRVSAGGYISQTITVSAELAPLLAQAPQDYEFDLLKRITGEFTETKRWDGIFGLPAAAAMNSSFGIRRSYNGGIYNGFHTGADFASPPGAPVFAAAPGKVVLADLLNIRGNTIIIDHGLGVFTVYCHQSQLNVQLGDNIVTGQIIGLTGSTGRITGPHLHWEVWVNGTPVNPLQWAKQRFP